MTGATGFIGSHVLGALQRRKVEVMATSKDRQKAMSFPWYEKVRYSAYDISKPQANVFEHLGSPDLMIHLAWEGLPNYQQPFHMEENYPRHCAVIKNMLEAGLKKLVVVGTCLEYGMRTGSLSEDMPPQPLVAYAKAKNALREYIEQLKETMDFDFKWIRLFYMYGEGQNEKSLLPQLRCALELGDKSFNMSGGKQVRDYLPVETVAENIVRVALQEKVSGVINCCSGKPVSIKDLVEDYMKKSGKSITFNWGHYPYLDYEPMEFWGDTRKLKEALNG